MANSPTAALTAAHDACLAAWTEAFRSGDGTPLAAFTAPTYQGFFAYAGTEQVEPVDRTVAAEGVRQFAAAFKGAVHRAQGRTVHLRDADEAVIAYERVIEREGRPWGSFLVLQTWRQTDGRWQVVREVAEHIASA